MLEIKEKSSEEVSSSQESITRFLENGHVAIWLMKDFCWCSGFRALGVAMAVPTIALAAYLVYRVRSNSRDVVHNAAVLFWLCANTTWMIGEFWFADSTRPQAKLFFIAGLGMLMLFYMWSLWRRVFIKKDKE
jgi:hypothetical protein